MEYLCKALVNYFKREENQSYSVPNELLEFLPVCSSSSSFSVTSSSLANNVSSSICSNQSTSSFSSASKTESDFIKKVDIPQVYCLIGEMNGSSSCDSFRAFQHRILNIFPQTLTSKSIERDVGIACQSGCGIITKWFLLKKGNEEKMEEGERDKRNVDKIDNKDFYNYVGSTIYVKEKISLPNFSYPHMNDQCFVAKAPGIFIFGIVSGFGKCGYIISDFVAFNLLKNLLKKLDFKNKISNTFIQPHVAQHYLLASLQEVNEELRLNVTCSSTSGCSVGLGILCAASRCLEFLHIGDVCGVIGEKEEIERGKCLISCGIEQNDMKRKDGLKSEIKSNKFPIVVNLQTKGSDTEFFKDNGFFKTYLITNNHTLKNMKERKRIESFGVKIEYTFAPLIYSSDNSFEDISNENMCGAVKNIERRAKGRIKTEEANEWMKGSNTNKEVKGKQKKEEEKHKVVRADDRLLRRKEENDFLDSCSILFFPEHSNWLKHEKEKNTNIKSNQCDNKSIKSHDIRKKAESKYIEERPYFTLFPCQYSSSSFQCKTINEIYVGRGVGLFDASQHGFLCTPDLLDVRLSKSPKGIFVLASGCVWEAMSGQEVMDLIAKYINENNEVSRIHDKFTYSKKHYMNKSRKAKKSFNEIAKLLARKVRLDLELKGTSPIGDISILIIPLQNHSIF